MAEMAQDLDEAFKAARAEGVREGDAAGYARGRAEAADIMGHDEAKGRIEAAAELAGDPAITVERAVSLMGKMPRDKGSDFASIMKASSPDVGPNVDPSESDRQKEREARTQQLRAAGAAASRARR